MPVETSIVIRTLNESKHLGNLLQGIHDQNYHDWEIILVDSGSTDGTVDIARRYGANIYHIPQEEFTFGRSLNVGCEKAQGRYLVFASGHVWPLTNNWLRNMIQPFNDSSVAMVYGRQRGADSSRLSEMRDLESWFGPSSNILIDEAKANNGNSAIRRDLWLDQHFDEMLPGLEDVDWARKVERQSYRVYYAADAGVYHLHEETLKQVYRRYLREAIAAKQMFPNYRFTRLDLLKGVPYFILRDFLYALRNRKLLKTFQVPATRMSQFLGIYRGVRHYKQMGRDVVHSLTVPEKHERIVIEGPGRHCLQQTDTPQIGPDDVLIQVAYAEVCGQDLEVAGDSSGDGKAAAIRYPIVPGRGYSGIVVGCGSQVNHLRKGHKVAGHRAVGCGRCGACEAGNHYECANNGAAGDINDNGPYAGFLAGHSEHLRKLPLDMPLKYGVLVQPVAMCLDGLRKLAVQPGHTACVVGAGAIGNLCSQLLRARGIHVTTVDDDPRRLLLLYKYDVDTLTKLGAIDKYDYLVAASEDAEVVRLVIKDSSPSSQILLLGPHESRILQTDTGEEKLIHIPAAPCDADWAEAVRLVQSGTIRLDDHTATVEALENYQKAWEGLKTGNEFNVLLNVSKELAAI